MKFPNKFLKQIIYIGIVEGIPIECATGIPLLISIEILEQLSREFS